MIRYFVIFFYFMISTGCVERLSVLGYEQDATPSAVLDASTEVNACFPPEESFEEAIKSLERATYKLCVAMEDEDCLMRLASDQGANK
tara:strand:+ start:1202 stop:1465 length:264 start_codon:yes stop_codon:yes gene_type:complete